MLLTNTTSTATTATATAALPVPPALKTSPFIYSSSAPSLSVGGRDGGGVEGGLTQLDDRLVPTSKEEQGTATVPSTTPANHLFSKNIKSWTKYNNGVKTSNKNSSNLQLHTANIVSTTTSSSNPFTQTPLTPLDQLLHSHPPHPAFDKEFQLGPHCLGRGATAIVAQARRRSDSLPMAVKLIYKDRIPVAAWKCDRKMGMVPIEIFILKRLDHPNISKFVAFYEDAKFFYLVMEAHGSSAWNMEGISSPTSPSLPPDIKIIPTTTVSNDTDTSTITTTTTTSASILSRSAPHSPVLSHRHVSSSAASTSARLLQINTSSSLHQVRARRASVDLFDYLAERNRKRAAAQAAAQAAGEVLMATNSHPISKTAPSSAVTSPISSANPSPTAITITSTTTSFSQQQPLSTTSSSNLSISMMTPRIVLHIFKQVVSAIEYLHANSIVHGDIKEENIVMSPDWSVKLIDFGGSILMNSLSKPWIGYHHFHGTIHAAPPEILKGELYHPMLAEVWSLGVLLNIMAYGQPPFKNADDAINGIRSSGLAAPVVIPVGGSGSREALLLHKDTNNANNNNTRINNSSITSDLDNDNNLKSTSSCSSSSSTTSITNENDTQQQQQQQKQQKSPHHHPPSSPCHGDDDTYCMQHIEALIQMLLEVKAEDRALLGKVSDYLYRYFPGNHYYASGGGGGGCSGGETTTFVE